MNLRELIKETLEEHLNKSLIEDYGKMVKLNSMKRTP